MHSIAKLWLTALLALSAASAHARSCWTPIETTEGLTFHTEQPGGTVIDGYFRQFDGRLCLDPTTPESGFVRLNIDTASAATGLPELDDALTGPMFFHSERWPEATFESDSIKKLDKDHYYEVTGRLTLRDITRNLEVPFLFARDGDKARLEGETTIKRLDYGIGQGQWADTQWADNEVKLEFSVDLKKIPDERKE